MKKRLLTLMMSVMCLLGMNAQQEIVWEDPVGQYQAETVVYAAVTVNNMPSQNMFTLGYQWRNFSIGAFVNGELRDVVDAQDFTSTVKATSQLATKIQGMEPSETGQTYEMPVYAFRVGGDDASDNGAEIEFRVLVDRGVVYKARAYTTQNFLRYNSLTLNQNELASPNAPWAAESTINWQGDVSVNQPSQFYILNFAPFMQVESNPQEVSLDLRIGDPAINLREQFESFSYLAEDGKEVAAPLEGGFWQVQQEGCLLVEGDNVTAIAQPESGEPVTVMYNYMGDVGSTVTAYINVLEPWVYVDGIEVKDIDLYKGQMPIRPEVIFNNGETTPTETGYTLVSNNPDVVTIENNALNPISIGEATVTITSVGTNSDGNTVSHTFAVNVISALDKFGFYVADELVSETTLEVWRYDEEIDLANMLPYAESTPVEDWYGDLPFGFTDYTITSNAPEVVSVEMDPSGMQVVKALKKGVATLTYTNSYDPSKTATVVVTVKQAPTSIEFVSYSIDGGDEIFFANRPAAMIEAGLGQAITVKTRVVPEDADFNEGTFTMECMRADGLVEILTPSKAEGNECSISFKGIATGNFLLHAQVEFGEDGVEMSKSIQVSLKESVTSIEVAEETTLWIHSNGQTFDFPITVLPETATVKDLEFTYEPIGDSEFGETSPIDIYLGYEGFMLTAMYKADVKVTATSVENPAVSKTFNVYIKRQVDGIVFETDGETSNINMYNDGQEYNVYVRILPADADFVEEELTLVSTYNNENMGGETGWEAYDSRLLNVVQTPGTPEAMGEYYYNYRIMGKALCPEGFTLTATYSGETQGMPVEKIAGIDITVNEKINVPAGWSWISLTSGTNTTKIPTLVEARSQSQLVYNDPVYGYFGDLEMMYPSYDAYKLDMEESYIMYPTYNVDYATFLTGEKISMALNTGWNWIGYPYEYRYMVSDVFDATQFAEGDIILSKNSGLAALKNGEWENDFELEPNTGYMIYHNGDETSVGYPGRFELPQGAFVAVERAIDNSANSTKSMTRNGSVWNYDGSRFANTMAIIGKLEMNDLAEDYTIGAFVGDECRGEGKVVNGTAYITVAGDGGEEVSFRLYNKWNGQYSDVNTKLAFTDLAGSVNAPVILNAPNVTGIDDVAMGGEGIYFNGNVLVLGQFNGVASIMTIDGRVAATTTQSTISLDELPAGVYVVVIDREEGRIVKKISKN